MRTVERTFAIIGCFSPSHPSLTLQEIANRTGFAKSTTFRIVGTLERLGYLVRLPDLQYCLSPRFAHLAAIAKGSLDVRRLLRPVLEDLVMASGESVSLHCVRGRFRHCVDIARSKSPLANLNKLDQDIPLGLGAASMTLMAYMDESDLKEIIGSAAAAVQCSVKELTSILKTTRQYGYAVSHGGGIKSVTGIAAPIFDSNGAVDYTLAVILPTKSVRGRVTDLVLLAKRAAIDASERLGGSGGLQHARARLGEKKPTRRAAAAS